MRPVGGNTHLPSSVNARVPKRKTTRASTSNIPQSTPTVNVSTTHVPPAQRIFKLDVRRLASFNVEGSNKQIQPGSQHPQGSVNTVKWMPQSQNLQPGSQNTQGSVNTVRWMPQSQNLQSGSLHTQGSIKTSQHQAQTQEDPASKRPRWR
ncbi:hypothetical protein V6N12_031183 [Hibiscus sabdariffa]|uniref:Uncharacterized protein n=1 Tax=Hibiscus sabdariffa TaxID=183260 RepID=A0ABR2E878_9ROSI